MDPSTKEHNIKYFRIEGLFNDRTVELPFDQNFKILIGENGLGKTSILNALYYTLTCKFSKLNSLIFNKVVIEFNSGKKVEIEKVDLELSEDEDRLKFRHESRMVETINHLLSISEKELISENIGSDDFRSNKQISSIINRLEKQVGYPSQFIKRSLIFLFSGKSAKMEEAKRIIQKEMDAEILYFPTYRRIEEELNKLGTVEEIKIPHDDKRLIQFGMEDVSLTFNRVMESIKNSSIIGFSEITGEMLSQYLQGPPQFDSTLREIIKPDNLKIILERVGSNITPSNKETIIQLVDSKESF